MTSPCSTYSIFLKDYSVRMSVGVFDHEKVQEQCVIFSIKAQCAAQDFSHDDINRIVSYDDLKAIIDSTSGQKHFHLLEHLCQEIINQALEIKGVISVELQADKPDIYQGNPKSAGVVMVGSV